MKTEWKQVKLGDYADFSNGINFGKDYYSKGIKLITVSDFKDRLNPNYDTLVEVDSSVVRESDLLRNDDIVFVRSNGNKELVGRCMIIKNLQTKLTYSGFCIRARFNNFENASPSYFVYYFKSPLFRKSIANSSVGANIQNLNQEILSSHKVALPPLKIQQKIANILSRYDEAIENNNKRIKLLEQMAQNLYKEWFVRFRFPGWQNAEFENGIPKGWKVTKIGDYVKIKSGFAFKSEWWQDDGCPVVKIKDIDNGSLDISQLDCVSEEHSKKAKTFLLKEGDLVIAMTGATIGKIGLVPKIDNLYTNQRVGKFFFGENPYEKMPIMYCLFSQVATTEMIFCLSGASSAQPNISPEQLESIKFFYNEKIVKDFNVKTAPIFKMILKLRENNQNLAKQRDLLLPRLMIGKVEVR